MEHGTGSRPDRAPLRERISAQLNDGDPMTDPGGGKTADGSARWRSSVMPLALLLLALATVFPFGGDRGHFYRDPVDEHYTGNTMTVAENLSPEHDFLGFYRLTLDDDSNRTYVPYNRFPVLGHVLIKLATLPFPDDISARLFAARMLMLAFFAAAATLAWLALCVLVRNRWAALAATLLAFSSYYALYYNDMVATEGVVDLFGLMLVFHGMAVFATEGRFGQLLAKTCAALLLGWHVYALLLPFVVLGLAVALRRRDGEAFRRHVVLGVVAVGFGTVVLAANFTREYVALGGEVAVAELPSVESMLRRTGISQRVGGEEYLKWPAVTARQLKRASLASVPYAVIHFIGDGKPDAVRRMAGMRTYVALGFVLSTLVVLAALALFLSPATRHRLPLAALALSGPCWTFSMRYQSHVPFEGMFSVGIPLAIFALMLSRLDAIGSGGGGARRYVRCSVLASVIAMPMFVLSSFLMARAADPDPERATYARALTADVDSIRKLVEGRVIFFSRLTGSCSKQRRWRADWKYYFTGSVFTRYANRRLADFVVSERIEGARTLTPGNRFLFLYDPASYDAALSRYEQYAQHGAPVLDSPDYDVHLVRRNTGNELLYFHDHCPGKPGATSNRERSRFFVHVWPSDANDLPADRRQLGFEALVDFRHTLWGWRKDGKCYAVCRLPDYGIARVHTGRTIRRSTNEGRGYRHDVIWEDVFSPDRATGGDLRSLRPAP